MTLLRFASTQRLTVGVRLPTDWGLVLPRWEPRSLVLAWRCVGGRLACHLHPVGASELRPDQRRKQLPNISSGISHRYFPR
jgi:hypothetical protein